MQMACAKFRRASSQTQAAPSPRNTTNCAEPMPRRWASFRIFNPKASAGSKLPTINLDCGQSFKILTGGLIACTSRGATGQANQTGGGTVHQAQGLIQREASLSGGGSVEVIPTDSDGTKECLNFLGTIGMTLLARLALALWQVNGEFVQ